MQKESKNNKPWSAADIVYHIYPRSFYDSSGDGVGDLKGITEKLDYLKGTENSLHVDAIWLSPFYNSPMADFGYDISDYCNVDPLFGNMQDFEVLIDKAHKRGIKIMVDFVPNHTSSQHPWFLESRSSKNNPKRNWYLWRNGIVVKEVDGEKTVPPNNWLSVFGGSGWEFDITTQSYYFHSFLKEQPDLNWRNPEVRQAMKNVLQFWIDKGVDGFRVDAINWLVKDEQFRDDPVNSNYQAGKENPYNQFTHDYSQDRQGTLNILAELCEFVEKPGNIFMVTEVHAGIPGMSQYYRVGLPGHQSPFNFNLIGMPWDAGIYKKFIDDFEQSLLPKNIPNYVLGNHDQYRVASRLGHPRARLSAMLQFCLRGMSFIYYGDELGMENGQIPPELVQDPFEKNVPGFGLGRDPQRTPMQWNGTQFAGFSVHQPWLPINENHQHVNVEIENKDSRSMLSLYKFLINYRQASRALRQGGYEPFETSHDQLLAFYRVFENEKLFAIFNFSDQPQTITLPIGAATIVCTTYLDRPEGEAINGNNFLIRAHEGYLLKM